MQQENRPMYSIIIPTYNEASKPEEMREHLKSIDEYFKNLGQSREIIIVLDGPTDGTPDLVAECTKDIENVRIINRTQNIGKGYSVREGLLAAEGHIRIFTDMDGATPINMLDRFIPKFGEGADVVIGSRDLQESEIKIHQPKWKEMLGDFGNLLIQAGTGLWGVKDTQCGFKAFTEQVVKDVLPRTTVDTWGIDFEILMISKKLGYKITEVPVDWLDKGESLVGLSGYFSTFRDLFKVKLNMLMGVYHLNRKIVYRKEKASQEQNEAITELNDGQDFEPKL
jgi:dolichyl-phosphate beta-glucosyltransferase